MSVRVRVVDVIDRIRIGWSAGLNFRYCGLNRMVAGRSTCEALMAACTSRAAPSMSRDRSNCSWIWVWPVCDREVSSDTPARRPRRFSRGVATLVAMVSGLAPGRRAETWIAGRSNCGRGDTGSWK